MCEAGKSGMLVGWIVRETLRRLYTTRTFAWSLVNTPKAAKQKLVSLSLSGRRAQSYSWPIVQARAYRSASARSNNTRWPSTATRSVSSAKPEVFPIAHSQREASSKHMLDKTTTPLTHRAADLSRQKDAEKLAGRIRAHWQAKGFDVNTWVEKVSVGSHMPACYCVRSDLGANGLPQR